MKHEDIRGDLKTGELIMAMTRDAFQLVHEGYVIMIKVFGLFSRLVTILLYTLAANIVFKGTVKARCSNKTAQEM